MNSYAETLASPSNTTRQIIMAKLTELLHDGRFVDYEEIVHKVSTFSRKACSDSSNAGKETIPICVRIQVVHEKIIYERIQLLANAIANADTMCGMVPSSKKSINVLRIKKLTSDDFKTHTSCVVCLENFVSGTEVTCMPCLHVFHQDCITNWLENSHYCPICRFQMPTEYEDEEEKEVDDDEEENEPTTYEEEEEVDGEDEDAYEYEDEDDNYYDFCEDEDENVDSCFEIPTENDGVDYCDIRYEYYNDYLLQMPVEEHEDEDQDDDECQCENNQLYHTCCKFISA